MRQIFFYSNVKYLIDSQYSSIYSFIKNNKIFKQNTIQDYYNRDNTSSIYPKFENLLLLAECFNISLDDLVYKDLSSEIIK